MTDYTVKSLLSLIGISTAKFHDWKKRSGMINRHNGKIPKGGYLLNWERNAIVNYAREHPGEGYRRLTYMMLDADVVAVSPSTTYRVLKSAGLLNRWIDIKIVVQ